EPVAHHFFQIGGQKLLQHAQARLPPVIRPAVHSSNSVKSTWSRINCLRGSTLSPISVDTRRSALAASSMVTCSSVRVAGFIVVSHNCSGFISPRPLYRCSSTFLPSSFSCSSSCSSVQAYRTVSCLPLFFVILYR